MADKLYIDIDKAVGMDYLSDWYQNSIDDTKPPIWTDEHIYELVNDFLVIPNDTSTADVVEVVRCKDCRYGELDDAELPHRRFCRYNGCDWNHEYHFCSYGERKEKKE